LPVINDPTISGGEPLPQPEGLCNLLSSLVPSWCLSAILVSGDTLEEIDATPSAELCIDARGNISLSGISAASKP